MQFGIAEAVNHWAKYRPDAIAVYANGKCWTYAELNALAMAMAERLKGVRRGTRRVAVAVGTKIRLLAAILGVLRTGRSVVVLNTALPSETIRVNLGDASVRAMLYDKSHAHLAKLLEVSIVAPQTALASPLTVPLRRRGPGHEWGVIYSSGTTGVPKGIVRDQESIVTELIGWCLELGLTRHSRFYIGRPIYYTGGLVLALATLLVGGTVVCNEYQNDDSSMDVWIDYKRTLEDISIDFAFFIPEQLRDFLRITAEHRPKSARTILTMGSPIKGTEKTQVVTALGSEIIESWGNSESLGTITDPEDVQMRPDSIGRPFLTDEMWIVDEKRRPVGPHVLGSIAGSENAGFLRYCKRRKETELVKQKKLIVSEDLGYRDENGFFYIRGRSQFSVVFPNGSTVFLQELEGEIRQLPMIRDCLIVAKTGETEIGAQFFVAVILEPGSQESAWESAVRRRLEPRIPVEKIRVFEQLPRLPSGKINRLAIDQEFERTV